MLAVRVNAAGATVVALLMLPALPGVLEAMDAASAAPALPAAPVPAKRSAPSYIDIAGVGISGKVGALIGA